MALVLADSGAVAILTRFFNAADNDLTLKLFVNNVTPADTDIAATYTEATGGGYSAKALTEASWTVSTVGGIAQAAAPEQTFTFTGPLTTFTDIYGYYIVDGAGTLIYAERSATPNTPNVNGYALLVTPVFKLSHGTPT